MPSEFKKLWDELCTELLDALPDYIDDYRRLTVLCQQLFVDVKSLIQSIKVDKLDEVSKVLFGNGASEADIQDLGLKLQSVFKNNSQAIFSLDDEQIQNFITSKFRENCLPLFEDDVDVFDENIDTPDFIRFVRQVIALQLHMVLSDPPIEMVALPISKAICAKTPD